MSSRALFLVVCAVLVAATFGSAVCKNPKVVTEYFTTGDATIVSHIALIGEFTVSCADPNADGLLLFAEIDGHLTPIARIDSNKYQVSATSVFSVLLALLSHFREHSESITRLIYGIFFY